MSVEDELYRNSAATAIGGTLKSLAEGDLKFTNQLSTFARLNTFFHLDTDTSTSTSADRGAVISTRPIKATLGGFRSEQYLYNEFFIPVDQYPVEQQETVKERRKAFQTSAELVLVEIGADCDHAQDTDRTRRYLFGVEVPAEYLHLMKHPSDHKLRGESLQLLGPWLIQGAHRYLLVSCSRYFVIQDKRSLGVVRYRLRSPIVTKLLHHHSVWCSRPGIIEFRVDGQSNAPNPGQVSVATEAATPELMSPSTASNVADTDTVAPTGIEVTVGPDQSS